MLTGRKNPGRSGLPARTPLTTSRILILLICLLALPFAGCSKPPEKARRPAAINVRVQRAEKKSLRPFIESIGSLAPCYQVTVSSELDGILDSITVTEGMPVNKDELVATIRPTDYRLAVEQAAAVLAQSEATLANLRQEYKRKEALFNEELLTRQQFDDISARVRLAEAEKDRAKAGVNLARERLSRTRILAPLKGTVKEKKVSAGDYVRNGSFLLSIVQNDPLKLLFSVSEKDTGALRIGQEVEFTTDAFFGRTFSGKLSAIMPTLNEQTRTLGVEALVPNPDRRLKPGIFTRVTLYTGPAKERIVVPVIALIYESTITRLFTVEGDKAREKQVKTGGKYGEYMEIVEGLNQGETVVTVGQNNLMEGATVHVAR